MRKKIVLVMIVFIGILITSCMNLNNPPTIPNNPVPADKAKDVPVNTTLSWNATDPDKDILIYKVYFGENSNPLFVNKGQVDNKYNPGILKYNTTYYWKIVVSDGKGGETSSPVWSFTTERNNPLVKPNTEVPTNGSMNIEITPYFSWRSSDPEDDPITYDFYFGESIETLELYKSKLEKSNYNMTDRVLNYNTKYYWKIVAKDSKGFKTEGDIWSFTTKPQNTAPELEITYPENNSTNIELNPTITWSATDNENDEIKYKVYINGELKADNYTSKSYQLSNLNTNTTYTVKIIAIDEYNATREKTISFTTTKAPTISLNKPDNNSIVIGKEITLSWTASDPDNDALTFDIYLDKNTNPITKVKSDITETITTVTVTDYGTYYWKVVAKDVKEAKTESIVYSFTTKINQWQKTFGGSDLDSAHSIEQTTDGGFIVAGYTKSNDGDVTGNHGLYSYDYWIIKLDENGNLEWQKTFGGSDSDSAHSIEQTTDGGFIVAGYTKSNDGDVTGNHGGADYWIIKLDSNGNLEWQKTFGGSNWDYAQSIEQTTDGGFIVAGYTWSNDGDVTGNHGLYSYDYWIIKLDENGNLEWQKTFGGSDSDSAHSIEQTTDGGFIVAGSTRSYDGDVTGDKGDYDYWIIKLDESGNLK
ncbi:Ig-like domain-containing protein [Marinitoga litoralis]|uniref:Ig-like domain-containing protein n=1 Tax=Marinitoga litoralis TaxID=570855 RepID=UPI0019620DA8|nr:fibronectin type III domain-containing protein [Marinitoga litoralis]MBM7560374.1 regulation of enolase protein 1 (concanavalin A-like superfamily) [Marinitoga litoralis]